MDILDEKDWQPTWIDERRLTLMFQPALVDSFAVGIVVKERDFIKEPRNRLGLVSRISDFDLDNGRFGSGDLWGPCIESSRFARSRVFLSESQEAVELGMQTYSKETKISANVALASSSFDFLQKMLEMNSLAGSGADRLLLACGFVPPKGKVPYSRPITWPEKVADPARLSAEPDRMSFEIAGVFNATTNWAERRLKTLSRWMVVEA